MTEREQPTKRDAAERRELEAAGWEPKGHGAKTLWRSPADGRWYAHYQAVEMQTKGDRAEEEDRLLNEHGFERTAATDREQWVRREEATVLNVKGKDSEETSREYGV